MEHRNSTSNAGVQIPQLHERFVWWVLLLGDRLVVTGVIVTGFLVGIGSLVHLGVLAVGPQSKAATLFASGLTAGVLTLVTVALSINQLILSRVFDDPKQLIDRLEGTRQLRETVEDLADEPSSPLDPAAFLSMVGLTLRDRAAALEGIIERSDWEPSTEVLASVREIREYGANVDAHVDEQAEIIDVLDALLGTGYARNAVAIRHLE